MLWHTRVGFMICKSGRYLNKHRIVFKPHPVITVSKKTNMGSPPPPSLAFPSHAPTHHNKDLESSTLKIQPLTSRWKLQVLFGLRKVFPVKLNASKQTVAGLVPLLCNAQIIKFFQMAQIGSVNTQSTMYPPSVPRPQPGPLCVPVQIK